MPYFETRKKKKQCNNVDEVLKETSNQNCFVEIIQRQVKCETVMFFYHFKVGHSCHDALFHKSQIKFGSSLSKIAKIATKENISRRTFVQTGHCCRIKVLGVTKSFQSHLTFVAPAVPTEGKLLVDNKLKQHLFYSSSMSCSVLVY